MAHYYCISSTLGKKAVRPTQNSAHSETSHHFQCKQLSSQHEVSAACFGVLKCEKNPVKMSGLVTLFLSFLCQENIQRCLVSGSKATTIQ